MVCNLVLRSNQAPCSTSSSKVSSASGDGVGDDDAGTPVGSPGDSAFELISSGRNDGGVPAGGSFGSLCANVSLESDMVPDVVVVDPSLTKLFCRTTALPR